MATVIDTTCRKEKMERKYKYDGSLTGGLSKTYINVTYEI